MVMDHGGAAAWRLKDVQARRPRSAWWLLFLAGYEFHTPAKFFLIGVDEKEGIKRLVMTQVGDDQLSSN